MGTTAGAIAGGALGVVPALFTFGLSIPAGAVVGGTVGGATGTTLGASTGLIAVGVVGNIAYAYRVEIKGNAVYVRAKIMEVASDATSKAVAKKEKVQSAVLSCVKSLTKKASTFSRRA